MTKISEPFWNPSTTIHHPQCFFFAQLDLSTISKHFFDFRGKSEHLNLSTFRNLCRSEHSNLSTYSDLGRSEHLDLSTAYTFDLNLSAKKERFFSDKINPSQK